MTVRNTDSCSFLLKKKKSKLSAFARINLPLSNRAGQKKSIHRVYKPLASNLLSLYPSVGAEIRYKPITAKANTSERSRRSSKLPGAASGFARWAQCDFVPQRGAGLGEAICKEHSICHLIFRGVRICCSLPVIFVSLSATWPSNSMLRGFSSRSAAAKLSASYAST